jgi:hypothetical protein
MTWEWSFVRSRDAELIVTPQNYDAWMPEPPVKAAKYGNILGINLKVQSRNGGKADEKVNYFKFSLKATSKQPGVTINMPIDKASEDPDLRFMESEGVELLDAGGQSVKLICKDGESGSLGLVSFDGGGWTTLTVEAVLNDSTRLKGQLLKSGGEQDILIPKREASSKIASSWLKQYGSIGDQSDEEALPGNTNKGDGLTAYEEYRGVISKGLYKRLDPSKIELAVERKQSEENRFEGGFSLFAQATGIKIISFYEGELEPKRMINKNHDYAHVTDQHGMRIRDERLAEGVSGENQPAKLLNKTPGLSEKVVIDIEENKRIYRTNDTAGRSVGLRLPYSQADLISNTIAHELGHGIHLDHHGNPSIKTGLTLRSIDTLNFEVFNTVGQKMSIKSGESFTVSGSVGGKGCEESGDLNCIMAYTSLYQWVAYMGTNNGNRTVYRAVPFLPVGKSLCTSIVGTGINSNNGFFGDAKVGNCKAQIKVKD